MKNESEADFSNTFAVQHLSTSKDHKQPELWKGQKLASWAGAVYF